MEPDAPAKISKKRGGRRKGVQNLATRDIKALAQKHGPDAIRTLVRMMNSKKTSESARAAAISELLNRGYGRASQTVAVELGANDRLLALIEAGVARAGKR